MLELPPNAVAIQLRADQVCTGATGISLCNCTFLKARLDAIGGSYLCLIVPGTIGVDLKNMLQSVRPGLLPNCDFERPRYQKNLCQAGCSYQLGDYTSEVCPIR